MSAGNINIVLKLWEASLAIHQDHAPFRNHAHLYKTIDAIPYGEIPWKSLTLTHPDIDLEGSKFPWMEERHIVWYRDLMQVLQELISNPDFRGEFDYVPYHDYNSNGHQFQDFMSGNWAWRQAVRYYPCDVYQPSYLNLNRILLKTIPTQGAPFWCQLF